jgi:transketolase
MIDLDVRDAFFGELYKSIKKDKKIILLAVDQGALAIKKIKIDFPNNYFNIGIFEQTAVNFAAGLAHQGFKPYVYLISPFVLRAMEQIKIYLCSMNLNVTIVASGPGFTYASDGPTHYFNEDYGILKNFPNLNFFCTSDYLSAIRSFNESYKSKKPSYIRLEKGSNPKIHGNLKNSVNHAIKGKKILLISNGNLSVLAKRTIEENVVLKNNVGLLDITQFVPLNIKRIENIAKNYNIIVMLDESPLISSISKDIHYMLKINKKFNNKKIILMNTLFKFWKISGKRSFLYKKNKIDESSIKKKLLNIIKK